MKRLVLSVLLLIISFFLSIIALKFEMKIMGPEEGYNVPFPAYLMACLLYLLVFCGIYSALNPLFQNYRDNEKYVLTGVFSVLLFVVFRFPLSYLGLIWLNPILY
ncbi:hypothetical protein DesLBE_3352 [Desulfitobacterium sp. LBE]|uniref:Tripartite tricarboxylate transporter TctB family protein n=3 Tax=root TaxID=1 RepID=A0A098AVF2_DESHA|nr:MULTISPECIES: hypothetical protein [Desulfitobacterium]ACL18091.1 hypothetical protein Dhaf_0022 [Desulfitobacterium hafniense DCB-2]KTE93245.1 hypothetical protein AT727_14635 [Desulfitobacterium hafniense]MEA5022735.1 hypothetical protein [Desulfitobacterium hafniense]TWH58992.1 hypothetical protein DesLBE_3352 [Desulfitobacterium sp. LBE]CDX00062.1 Hypothetical protein DPCES_0175 [Desulfitobacterium hafniense]